TGATRSTSRLRGPSATRTESTSTAPATSTSPTRSRTMPTSRRRNSRSPAGEPMKQDARRAPVNVAEFRGLAEAALPREVFDHLEGGAEDERTLADNEAAFARLGLMPRVLRDVSARDLRTTVLGERVALPVLLAPVACQPLFHPDGAIASARAAAEARTIF